MSTGRLDSCEWPGLSRLSDSCCRQSHCPASGGLRALSLMPPGPAEPGTEGLGFTLYSRQEAAHGAEPLPGDPSPWEPGTPGRLFWTLSPATRHTSALPPTQPSLPPTPPVDNGQGPPSRACRECSPARAPAQSVVTGRPWLLWPGHLPPGVLVLLPTGPATSPPTVQAALTTDPSLLTSCQRPL